MTQTYKRKIVISDVHGCWDDLCKLLVALNYKPDDDLLVFVGDLVDKGPQPLATVRGVAAFKHKVLVLGNHEDKHIRYYHHQKRFEAEGIKNAVRDRRNELSEFYAQATDEDYAFLEAGVICYRLQEHGRVVVHAGVPPRLKVMPYDRVWKDMSHRDRKYFSRLKWVRCVDSDGNVVGLSQTTPDHAPWFEGYDGRFGHVVFGHWHRIAPEGALIEAPFATGIDTGAVYGGRLTALVFVQDPEYLGRQTVVQVECPQWADPNASYLLEARAKTKPLP